MIDIGASDSAAVMGVSPHTTPWQLWARKVGLLPEETEPTEIMRRGTQLERVVLNMFMDELDDTMPPHVTCRWIALSPHTKRWRQERPWQRATPDARIVFGDEDALVEIKCTVAQAPSVPRVDWLVQCLHQRMVFPEVKGQFLVAFGGLHLEWWSIPKHQKALDRVLREEEKFLELVEKQIPPPVRAADASVLAKAWPITKAEPIFLGDESLLYDEMIQDYSKRIKVSDNLKQDAEALIKAAMGDHEEALLPDGTRYTWKWHERKGFTVEPSRARRFKRVGGKENGE